MPLFYVTTIIASHDTSDAPRHAPYYAASNDHALRDAFAMTDPFTSRASASLEATAALLAATFTLKGSYRKNRKVRGPAAERWNAEADARRERYWATRRRGE